MRRILLSGLSVAFFGAAATAETLTLGAAADATLYQDSTGALADGAGDNLFVGVTGANAGNARRRALLRFDLAALPAGARIDAVSLSVTVNMQPFGAPATTAALRRLRGGWSEGSSNAGSVGGAGANAADGDSTWLHRRFDDRFWLTPGGDFAAAASATARFDVLANDGPVTATFASTPALVADVQSWVDAPGENFGWIMLGDESGQRNARRLHSRERGDGGPRLTVEFSRSGGDEVFGDGFESE